MSSKLLAAIAASFVMLIGCGDKGAFVETVDSAYDIDTTIRRFKSELQKRHLTFFHLIDHKKNAEQVGMPMRQTRVAFFGNPKASTVLVQCNPSIGVDLPLRMLFYTTYEGTTKITYTNPEYLSLKHNVKKSNCLKLLRQAHVIMRELAEATAKTPQGR